MSKKICFITPSHISSNPRLIKEVGTLTNEGNEVIILFAQTLNYLKLEDEKILQNLSVISYEIIKQPTTFKKITQKAIHLISTKLLKLNFNVIRFDPKYYSFLKAAIKHNADLYIAHNLAALPIAVQAAKKNKAKCGFDAEDFHRNEVTDNPKELDVKIKTFIEDKYLKELDYITAASPLIARSYQNLYPNLSPTIINNVFEIKYQPEFNLNHNSQLKLFWFSQTIGKGRGLEQVIEALNFINNPLIELHLLGNLDKKIKFDFNSLAKFKIHYYKPISNDEIFTLAAKFDVGLALELHTPLNRDICLTNKIFTYLISGLAIIASKTQAQKKFITENEGIGILYSIGDTDELANSIMKFYNDKNFLNECKQNAYQLAKAEYNWETESKKFIKLIERTLAD